MSNTSQDRIWQEISAEQALGRFNENLSEAGISEIKIPSALARDLMVTESAWQIATDPDINPVTPYMWNFNYQFLGSELNKYLLEDRDYFIAGHNGHGIASYGFGIVSRIGSLTVAQQQYFGGAFGESEQDLDALNEQIQIWNNDLWKLEQLRELPTNPLLVEFSSFRDFVRISEWQERDNRWSIVIDALESRVQAEMLLIDQDIKHQHLRASASHLMALLQADWRLWKKVFPDSELHASVKEFGDKSVHYLFLSTPSMYLVRKEGKWEWANNEDNEATDGDLQITVNSKFISFFDGSQELGIELKAKNLSDFRIDGNLVQETSFEYSDVDQSLMIAEESKVSEISVPAKEIEVFANLLVVGMTKDSVTIQISWSKSDGRYFTGDMRLKFLDMGHAVEIFNNTLMVGLDVFDCEDLENSESVKRKIDYVAAESVMDFLHDQLKKEDTDLWETYKMQPSDYRELDLTEADNILDLDA